MNLNLIIPSLTNKVKELIETFKQGSESGKILDPFNRQSVPVRDDLIPKKEINLTLKNSSIIQTDNLEINDVINSLPWQLGKKWSQRNVNQIKNIVIHQSASRGAGIVNVNAYHISAPNHISVNGCPHLAYHFWIDPLGKVYQANNIEDVTWHVKGYNIVSLGICLQGDFVGPSYKGSQTRPSSQQINSLKNLLVLYLNKIPQLTKEDIHGHEYFNPEKINCPGLYATQWIKDFKENNV